MKALGPLVVAVTIIEGCGAAQPLETVTAIVTAPLTGTRVGGATAHTCTE